MGDLKCLVELNKKEGILIKLKNPDGKIEQSIVIDGTKITTICKGEKDSTTIVMTSDKIVTTCKGSEDTSTTEQTSDSITITCKNFNVKSDNINLESKEKAALINKGTLDIKTTKETTIKGDKDIKLESQANMAMKAANTAIRSDSETKLKAMNLKTDAPQTEVKGASVKITGDAMVEVSGGIIKLQ